MTVSTLNDLTPAECLVLMNPKSCKGKELIKVTLLDLLARKLLVSEEREEKTRLLGRTVKRIYLGTGSQEGSPKPHERVLLDCVPIRDWIRLDELVKRIASKIKSTKAYKKDGLLYPMATAGLLERQEGLISSNFEPSDIGAGLEDELSGILNEGEAQMLDWLENDIGRAKLFLGMTGTKILLIPSVLPYLREAKAELFGGPIAGQIAQSTQDTLALASLDLDLSAFDAIGALSFDAGLAVDGGGGGDAS